MQKKSSENPPASASPGIATLARELQLASHRVRNYETNLKCAVSAMTVARREFFEAEKELAAARERFEEAVGSAIEPAEDGAP